MVQKNKERAKLKEQRARSGTFVGCRPTYFKDKTKYSRKGRKREE